MRTIAYVDGYNFYHGRIKHTPYKWLDLQALLAGILRAQDPAADLVAVKFFTALIKAPLARMGVQSVNAQQNYHRALGLKGVEVVLRKFTLSEAQAPRRPEMQARRSASLEEASDWTRHHILDDELAAHLLPQRVPTGRKLIEKPAHW